MYIYIYSDDKAHRNINKKRKCRLEYIASLLCNQRVSKSLCTICLDGSDSCILLSRSIGCALCWLLSWVLNPKSGHVVWSDKRIWTIPNCLPVSILPRIGCLDLLAPRPAVSGGPRSNNYQSAPLPIINHIDWTHYEAKHWPVTVLLAFSILCACHFFPPFATFSLDGFGRL